MFAEIKDVQQGRHGCGPVGADRRFIVRGDPFEKFDQVRLNGHMLDEVLIVQAFPEVVRFLDLVRPVAEDMVDRIHNMVHMDIFQFLVIHGRVTEIGPHMVVKIAIGVLGIEHYAIAIEYYQFKFRHSPTLFEIYTIELQPF